jgi:nucleotide-binding universal stress UspA family protein
MKVLLATDGSEYSEAAVSEIARRGLPPGTEVTIVSVAETPPVMTTAPYPVPLNLPELEAAARERAGAAAASAEAALRAGADTGRLSIATKTLSGGAKQAILVDAEEFSADLIVVGACDHSRLEHFLLGSVAQAVALHAKCSVQIARLRP